MFILLTHAQCAGQIFINEKENLVFLEIYFYIRLRNELPFLSKLQFFHFKINEKVIRIQVYIKRICFVPTVPWLSHWTNIASVYATAVYNVECKGNVYDWN